MPAAREREKLEESSRAELLKKDKMASKEFTYHSTLNKDLFSFFNITQNHTHFFPKLFPPVSSNFLQGFLPLFLP